MLDLILVCGLILCLALAVLAWIWVPRFALSHSGRWLVLISVAILPVGISAAGLTVQLRTSSQTTFCLSCHPMQEYGRTLFVDNRKALAAVHYQERSIERDKTCFACHTDYAMFGNMKAKLNGLRHVWVQYVGKVPEKLALYQPYPNHNCLHCHEDARGYVENPVHKPFFAELSANTRSCLQCHNVAHDKKAAADGHFWQAGGGQ
ncbi:MAG: NapC/NirT family cytochrome c [Deltaproteobacteria bacterium]|nr:NapC/NirT family cytochrome c [Deltaproteobacteria bacterium]